MVHGQHISGKDPEATSQTSELQKLQQEHLLRKTEVEALRARPETTDEELATAKKQRLLAKDKVAKKKSEAALVH